jgi:hypothetical protein
MDPEKLIVAILLALPGISVAMLAKPRIWGDGALLFGIFATFALPIAWITIRRATP